MTALQRMLRRHGPLLLGLALAAGMLAVSEYAQWRAERAFVHMQRSLELRLELARLWRQVLEAETGQRGYLITGKDDYASPYYGAISQVEQSLGRLRQFYTASGRNTAELDTLSLLVKRKMEDLAATYRLRAGGDDMKWRAEVETDIGRDRMVLVNNSVNRLLASEQQALDKAQERIFETILLGRIGVILMTVLAVLVFVSYLRQSARLDAARRQQEEFLERERDRLEIMVEQRTRQLSRLASYLVTAREDERARIARELHDELGALFTTAKLDVARLRSRLTGSESQVAERLQHLAQTLSAGVALKRRIIEDLRPSSLSNLGLVASLEILLREFSSRIDARIDSAFEEVRLPPAAELTVYRLVQEALTNISKYAAAKHVQIAMQRRSGRVEIRVCDDGRGFDPGAIPPTSHGLFGMRFRIEESGGRFSLTSRPGEGTLIEATLPEQADAAAESAPPP